MGYHSNGNQYEAFLLSLPLILFLVLLSENASHLMRFKTAELTQSDLFKREASTIIFGFIVGGLTSVIFGYNNSDLRGWWPIYLYIICLYGGIFSILYSIISYLFAMHNLKYNFVFALIIVMSFLSLPFLPLAIYVNKIGKVDILIMLLAGLSVCHIAISLTVRIFSSYKHKVIS